VAGNNTAKGDDPATAHALANLENVFRAQAAHPRPGVRALGYLSDRAFRGAPGQQLSSGRSG
jgi:hypothetical protein